MHHLEVQCPLGSVYSQKLPEHSERLTNVTFRLVISNSRQLPDLTGKIRGIFCTLACDPSTFPVTKQPSSQARREKSLPQTNLLAKTFQCGLPSRVPGKQVPPRAGQGNLTYSGLFLESPICNFPFGNLLQPAVARPNWQDKGHSLHTVLRPQHLPCEKTAKLAG